MPTESKMTPRKKKTPQNKMYFSADTEAAIVRFNASDDDDDRNRIYREEIEYPFDKLAENVINTFKFPYINQTFEDTKRQVVSYLVMNIWRYTQDNGKAYSYFSVIAKNYLIQHNTKGYKYEKTSVSFSDSANEESVPLDEVLASMEAPNARANDDTKEFVALMIGFWERNTTRIFKKKRDIEIAIAVIELFRRAEGIENFNKKALYLLVREMVDCKTNYITKVINRMKVYTEAHLQSYYSTGVIEERSEFFEEIEDDDPDDMTD
jgi:hypothetical protein